MNTFNFNFPELNVERILQVREALAEKAPQEILDLALKYFGQSAVSDITVDGFAGVKILAPSMVVYSPAGVEITSNGFFLHLSSELAAKLIAGDKAAILIVGHEYGHLVDMSNCKEADIESYELDLPAEIRCDSFAANHFGDVTALISFFQNYLEVFLTNVHLTSEMRDMVSDSFNQRINSLKN